MNVQKYIVTVEVEVYARSESEAIAKGDAIACGMKYNGLGEDPELAKVTDTNGNVVRCGQECLPDEIFSKTSDVSEWYDEHYKDELKKSIKAHYGSAEDQIELVLAITHYIEREFDSKGYIPYKGYVETFDGGEIEWQVDFTKEGNFEVSMSAESDLTNVVNCEMNDLEESISTMVNKYFEGRKDEFVKSIYE